MLTWSMQNGLVAQEPLQQVSHLAPIRQPASATSHVLVAEWQSGFLFCCDCSHRVVLLDWKPTCELAHYARLCMI